MAPSLTPQVGIAVEMALVAGDQFSVLRETILTQTALRKTGQTET